MINYEDFAKVELKVGKILEAADHPNADKLYILKVDIGEGVVVQLVAGVKNYYKPEELTGKLVVVVVNLEPKLLRGVESNGMVLAANAGENLAILTLDREIPPGTKIK
jgi:methionyl-tRNA synthetase